MGDTNAHFASGGLYSLDFYTKRVSDSQKMDEVVWVLTPHRDDWLAYTFAVGSTYED